MQSDPQTDRCAVFIRPEQGLESTSGRGAFECHIGQQEQEFGTVKIAARQAEAAESDEGLHTLVNHKLRPSLFVELDSSCQRPPQNKALNRCIKVDVNDGYKAENVSFSGKRKMLPPGR